MSGSEEVAKHLQTFTGKRFAREFDKTIQLRRQPLELVTVAEHKESMDVAGQIIGRMLEQQRRMQIGLSVLGVVAVVELLAIFALFSRWYPG